MDEISPKNSRFFLGANTSSGFSSLYDNFVRPTVDHDFVWVIKGGPGCGKSTFMKRIGAAAEERGCAVEYILCSGDPDSVDGLRIPEKHLRYVDGTAPHVAEAPDPGAGGKYLDLSRFLDSGGLTPRLRELQRLSSAYKAEYADAYALLSAGARLLPRNLPLQWDLAVQQKLSRRMAGILQREVPKKGKTGRCSRRFLSAYSCKGHLRLDETLSALCPRIYLLENELGLGNQFAAQFAESALARGWDLICCPDPLEPERTEAVLIPEAGMALLAADRSLPYPAAPYRRLRLDAVAAEGLDGTLLRQRRKSSAALLSAAQDALIRAKVLHDALEQVYLPYVDFSGLDALTQAHIRRLDMEN